MKRSLCSRCGALVDSCWNCGEPLAALVLDPPAARMIVLTFRERNRPDHACRECVGDGEMVTAGFQCVLHKTIAYLERVWPDHACWRDRQPCLPCQRYLAERAGLAQSSPDVAKLAFHPNAFSMVMDPLDIDPEFQKQIDENREKDKR